MRKLVPIGVAVAGLLAVASIAGATSYQKICGTMGGPGGIPFGTGHHSIRFQTSILQKYIQTKATITNVEYYNYNRKEGIYKVFRVYLCHTLKFDLSTTFAENYSGTPVLVANIGLFKIPAAPGWFSLGLTGTSTTIT